MPTLTTVTLTSENPKYNHRITVTVDNDLSDASTIVVPDTYFPYIVKLAGYPDAEGKRYISSWLYNKLLFDYQTDLGKVLNTLEEGVSVYPYYTIDYQVYQDKIVALRNETITESIGTAGIRDNRTFNRLQYYGYYIYDFQMDPKFLLKWLDFPVTDPEGSPVEKFPDIIDYWYSKVYGGGGGVQIQLSYNPDPLDVFNRVYIIDILHAVANVDVLYIYAEDTFTEFANLYGITLDGYYSRRSKKINIQKANAPQTISTMIQTASNPNIKTLIPNSGLSSAANSVLNKLNQINSLPALPKLPKLPRISLSKIVVDARIKLMEKKNIKRIKKSSNFNFSKLKSAAMKNPLSANATKLAQSPRQLKSMADSQLAKATAKLTQVSSKV